MTPCSVVFTVSNHEHLLNRQTWPGKPHVLTHSHAALKTKTSLRPSKHRPKTGWSVVSIALRDTLTQFKRCQAARLSFISLRCTLDASPAPAAQAFPRSRRCNRPFFIDDFPVWSSKWVKANRGLDAPKITCPFYSIPDIILPIRTLSWGVAR